jgi:hypothetical protein
VYMTLEVAYTLLASLSLACEFGGIATPAGKVDSLSCVSRWHFYGFPLRLALTRLPRGFIIPAR